MPGFADLAAGLLVDQLQVVAGHGDPGGPRPDRAGGVGQEDVQHLGHADAVDDVDAEVPRSTAGTARRAAPRPPRRPAAPRPSASAGIPARSMLAKNVGPPKNSVAPYLAAVSAIRSGRDGGRQQHARRPRRQREQQRVAQAVGEERLRGGQAAVVRPDAEHLLPVGLADHRDRPVPVHGALRGPRWCPRYRARTRASRDQCRRQTRREPRPRGRPEGERGRGWPRAGSRQRIPASSAACPVLPTLRPTPRRRRTHW